MRRQTREFQCLNLWPVPSPSPMSAQALDHHKKGRRRAAKRDPKVIVPRRRQGWCASRLGQDGSGVVPGAVGDRNTVRRHQANETLPKGCVTFAVLSLFSYLGNEARFRAGPWGDAATERLRFPGISTVLAGGFSGALSGAQPGAQGRPGPWSGERFHVVCKAVGGASRLVLWGLCRSTKLE